MTTKSAFFSWNLSFMQFGVRRRFKNVDVRSVFRLVMMERLAKERITVKIASLFFKLFFTMDIDRHDCGKYNRYRVSILNFVIAVVLVVNKY
jgi:hypothetical protein